MQTLDDLPRLVPRPCLLSLHGLGRGGGERVACKIKAVFAAQGWDLTVASSAAVGSELLRASARAGRGEIALLTAGPRDLPLIAVCAWFRRPFAVYLQVPYWRALTWRDPLHAMAVLAYLFAVVLLARLVLANSRATAAGLPWRRVAVVWPVTRAELATNAWPPQPAQGLGQRVQAGGQASEAVVGRIADSGRESVIDVVCRLAQERGRGSRDVAALARLLSECRSRLNCGGVPVRVRHFGACAPGIRLQLLAAGGNAVAFQGYRDDWLEAGPGPVVLMSRYEGFGLAAFEAARAGRPVFVNEAFPDDLFEACPSIRRIRTFGCHAILPQLEAMQ